MSAADAGAADAGAAAASRSVPVIGVTTYHLKARFGTWPEHLTDVLPATYSRSVAAVGGVALLIPPVASAEAARAIVGALDGLIISGGEDVNPQRYGAETDPHVTAWNDERDASELLLLDAADSVGLPVLGICRGMQVMAVHAGGTLVQHLPDVVGHGRHSPADGEYSSTEIALDEDAVRDPDAEAPACRLASLLPGRLVGSSHHHQAVAEHPGFVAVAHDDDGVLQAMEAPGDRFAVAVQWHPEQREDVGVFAGLVAAARARRGARA